MDVVTAYTDRQTDRDERDGQSVSCIHPPRPTPRATPMHQIHLDNVCLSAHSLSFHGPAALGLLNQH